MGYIFYNNIFFIYVNRYAKCSISVHEMFSFHSMMCWKFVLRYTVLTVSKMIMSVLGCSLNSMCFNWILRDYYMTFSISALVLARDSHIKPDSESGGLIWVEGWYQGRYGKFHVIIFLSHILHSPFPCIDFYIAKKIFELTNCENKSLRASICPAPWTTRPHPLPLKGASIIVVLPFLVRHVYKVTLRSSGTDILYGCHLLLDVCIWSRALDVRLSEWCCSVSMVWVQIPSREEQKFDSSKI
jgi:hypothetical protein